MDQDLLTRLEALLADNSAAQHRLAREQDLLTAAVRRLRTGAMPGPILSDLWDAGVELDRSSHAGGGGLGESVESQAEGRPSDAE